MKFPRPTHPAKHWPGWQRPQPRNIMNPSWPKRIDCGQVDDSPEMPRKRASPKAKSDNVFGQARKPAKMFRAGLYARVSTNDQQTLPMQNRAMREYAARRGWTIALQVREVNSGAAKREAREKLLEAARRREIDFVLVWRLDRWGRSVTDLLATLQELEHLGVNATERAMRGVAKGSSLCTVIFKCLKTWTFGSRNSGDTDDLFVRSP